jgi:hypothetical protein
MVEDQEIDLKSPEESPPTEQQPLAMMDFAQWAAQKRNLLDDVPN